MAQTTNRIKIIFLLLILGLFIAVLSIWYISIAASCHPCAITFVPNPTLAPTAENLEQFPSPIPEFIAGLYKAPAWSGSNWTSAYEMCIWVHHEPFLRPGMSDKQVNEEIATHQTFKVDRAIIPVKAHLALDHKWCDGKPIGLRTCGGALSNTCVDFGHAEQGLHLAEIDIVNFKNQHYSYQWAFRTESDIKKEYGTPIYIPSTPGFY